jgi:hypothetical protein
MLLVRFLKLDLLLLSELHERLLALLDFIFKTDLLEKEGANLELIQLQPGVIVSLLGNRKQTLQMTFA